MTIGLAAFAVLVAVVVAAGYGGLRVVARFCSKEAENHWRDAVEAWTAAKTNSVDRVEVALLAQDVRKRAEEACADGRSYVLEKYHEAIFRKVSVGLRKRLWKFFGNFCTCVTKKFGSIGKSIRNHQWIVGSVLPAIAVLSDFMYYFYFNFSVLPYYANISLPALVSAILWLSFLAVVSLIVSVLVIVIFVIAVLAMPWLLAASSVWLLSLLLTALSLLPLMACRSAWCARLAMPRAKGWSQWTIRWRTFPRRISFSCAFAYVSVWLTICASLYYVLVSDPLYRANVVCRSETTRRTHVVVDPSLSVENPISIGANAGHLFVVPVKECESRAANGRQRERGPQADERPWWSIPRIQVSVWRHAMDRWNFLWPRGAVRKSFPQVVVVPLSRAVCIYEAEGAGDAPCSLPTRQDGTEGSTLLPVHLLVHFRNAELAEKGTLGDRGMVLEPEHRRMLEETVNALARCAAPDSPVEIKPYGFASSAPFAGVENSDDLNVRAANRRANAVYRELGELTTDMRNVNIESPPVWREFDEMIEERNARISSPSRERGEERTRDSFLDRVVVLDLLTRGRCGGGLSGLS